MTRGTPTDDQVSAKTHVFEVLYGPWFPEVQRVLSEES